MPCANYREISLTSLNCSDEEDGDDDLDTETQQEMTAAAAAETGATSANLLEEDSDISDDESLQEESERETSEKISFSFLENRESGRDGNKTTRSFTITEESPTRAFSWLKEPTSVFTF